jgi:hypothetical protein
MQETSFHDGTRDGDVAVVRALVDDASLETGPSHPDTPLTLAARSGHLHMVRMLVETGTDVNQPGRQNGHTALCEASLQQHLDVVVCLIANGGNVNIECDMLWTPLHEAAKLNREQVIPLLLAGGADIEKCDGEGRTPLYEAVQADCSHCTATLIAAGASLERVDVDGHTPFTHACYYGRINSAAVLVAAGASLDANCLALLPAEHVYRTEWPRLSLRLRLRLARTVLAEVRAKLPQEIARWRRAIEREPFVAMQRRALDICIALQDLCLPALVTLYIIDAACVSAQRAAFHRKWDLVTRVKHFRCD